MAIRAAAPPPTALNSETSCGIAVIFTVRAVYRPSPPPIAIPTAMMIQPVRLIDPLPARNTAVPPMAIAMPAADTRLPFRAVAGEFMRISPSTNAPAPISQAMRTSVSSRSTSGLGGFRGSRRGGGGPGFRLRRGRLAPEHLEHPIRDDVAADDVHRRERHRDEAEGLAQQVRRARRDEH